MSSQVHTEIVVLGAGPGGYAAAFYAADRGKKVILVEQDKRLGGVCLNRGCIPSKALLNATGMLQEAEASSKRGIIFSKPVIELGKLRTWKESVIDKLSQGIVALAQRRGVQVLYGRGHFEDSKTLRVETADGQKFVKYQKAIIAVGSKPALPSVFDLGNKRIMTSTEALEVEEIPEDLLVVGGGYIGMELGTVYARLGSKIVLVEALDAILAGADPDLARPVKAFAEKHFKEVRLKAKVTKMSTHQKKIKVEMEYNGKKIDELYDRVLISVGRVPNCEDLGLKNTKVERDPKGFILVNEKQETADSDILAIGDAVGGIMLAHKASKEARVA
ncbi:MAG: NAD(P)/FAD-dependent oxidoreductase, partial [Candidatus Omnitrophica bacterium]|nr:NAD(P)/FAD-dependent oxidoreductase [Candidatus Omnitrophota bacterium]